MRILKNTTLAAALGAAALAAPTMGATVTFFQFQGDSDMIAQPKELIFDQTGGLAAGPGSVGNNQIFSPGLTGMITGGLPGVTQSPPGIGFSSPYYILADLTLQLTGFAPVGNADVQAGSITQDLGSGTFKIVHPAFSQPLLSGTVSGGLLTEKKSGTGTGPGDAASILFSNVKYDPSILSDAFAANHLGLTGDFSIALSGLTGTYGTVTVGNQTHLASFTADATGTFDAVSVPAPATVWGGLGLFGLLAGFKVLKPKAQQA